MVFTELQLKAEDPPTVIASGLAERVTEGTPGIIGFTTTVVVAVFDPPAPVQVMAYSVVVAGESIWLPDVEVALVQAAEQEVVLVDVQARVLVAPRVLVSGLAERETVGREGWPPD